MQATILGKRWRIATVPNLGENRGTCDAPTLPKKSIRIAAYLKGEEKLEVLIHEMLHAAGWHIDESFVEQFARDSARTLWKMGYRDE